MLLPPRPTVEDQLVNSPQHLVMGWPRRRIELTNTTAVPPHPAVGNRLVISPQHLVMGWPEGRTEMTNTTAVPPHLAVKELLSVDTMERRPRAELANMAVKELPLLQVTRMERGTRTELRVLEATVTIHCPQLMALEEGLPRIEWLPTSTSCQVLARLLTMKALGILMREPGLLWEPKVAAVRGEWKVLPGLG